MEQGVASHRPRDIHLYRTKSVFHKYASFKILLSAHRLLLLMLFSCSKSLVDSRMELIRHGDFICAILNKHITMIIHHISFC
jgi:hypothetical protein